MQDDQELMEVLKIKKRRVANLLSRNSNVPSDVRGLFAGRYSYVESHDF